MSEPVVPPAEQVIRPFADFLLELEAGRPHAELGEALHEVVEAVRGTGKPGSVTFTVSIQPLKDAVDVLKVQPTVKTKVPELPRPATVWFPDRNGNLRRDNPNQLAFDSIRDVSAPDEPRALDGRELAAGEDR
jgi:hypothetical protein